MTSVKKFKIPHTFVIIFALIIISAIVTFIVPGGEYNKETLEFSYKQSSPQSWQVLTAFYKGFTRQAGIIVFILVIGAAFWVVNSCKAIDAGIYSF
ncbi:MAG: YfcC family protein, partial [Bacteroidales bacterium]